MFKHFMKKVKKIEVWRFKEKLMTCFLRRFCEAIAPCRLHISAVCRKENNILSMTVFCVYLLCVDFLARLGASEGCPRGTPNMVRSAKHSSVSFRCSPPEGMIRGLQRVKEQKRILMWCRKNWKICRKGDRNVPFRYLRDLPDSCFLVPKGEVYMCV